MSSCKTLRELKEYAYYLSSYTKNERIRFLHPKSGNWGCPSKEEYDLLVDKYNINKLEKFINYDTLLDKFKVIDSNVIKVDFKLAINNLARDIDNIQKELRFLNNCFNSRITITEIIGDSRASFINIIASYDIKYNHFDSEYECLLVIGGPAFHVKPFKLYIKEDEISYFQYGRRINYSNKSLQLFYINVRAILKDRFK